MVEQPPSITAQDILRLSEADLAENLKLEEDQTRDAIQKVKAGVAADIRSGLPNHVLMKKYTLSAKELYLFLDKLVAENVITRREIGQRQPKISRAGIAFGLIVLMIGALTIVFPKNPGMPFIVQIAFAMNFGLLGIAIALRSALPARAGWRWLFTVCGSLALAGLMESILAWKTDQLLGGVVVAFICPYFGLKSKLRPLAGEPGKVRCPYCLSELSEEATQCEPCGNKI